MTIFSDFPARPFEAFQPFAIKVESGKLYTFTAKTTGYETGLFINAPFIILLLLFVYKHRPELIAKKTES